MIDFREQTEETIEQAFFEALENHDLNALEKIPKSDLHNHAGRGGKLSDLSPGISSPSKPFDSLDDMQAWFEEHVKAHCKAGIKGYLYRVEAAFRQASRDTIQKLALSFGSGEIKALGGIEKFSHVMDDYKRKYLPDGVFIPELSLLRGHISHDEIQSIKEILSYGWFQSLDVCGHELAAPVELYRPIYQYAKSKNVTLKMHVGEFGCADDIRRAVEVLDLDEVHHGIAAVNSQSTMRFLREHGIVLNVCPMSNILLKRAKDYERHPIKTLYSEGVKVTINTDDLAIFDTTVSEEYLNLYRYKTLTKASLNEIRVGGLKGYGSV